MPSWDKSSSQDSIKSPLRLCPSASCRFVLPVPCEATMLFQQGAARLATQEWGFQKPRHCGSRQKTWPCQGKKCQKGCDSTVSYKRTSSLAELRAAKCSGSDHGLAVWIHFIVPNDVNTPPVQG